MLFWWLNPYGDVVTSRVDQRGIGYAIDIRTKRTPAAAAGPAPGTGVWGAGDPVISIRRAPPAVPISARELKEPNVVAIREWYGLSQDQFASLLGISVRTLRIETIHRPCGACRRDYDEALAFFAQKLLFTVIEDTCIPAENKRWLTVAPPGSSGTSLLVARPSHGSQATFIGNQTGGRVTFFLRTDDSWRDYRRMTEVGIEFVREPVDASYGTVAVFKDPHGNLWDLICPAPTLNPCQF